ncbi:hypothetical protein Vretifemale_4796 [Volvox reticuliferus]|uniref:DUF389 domain-containing protein n=1 Tax=Volvox reticuliferus TaxID=1737510 RepID=A0A8J4FH82_9CHLO|nr:hypothetical protein Vretifemale_4796 [Volvox reticuliferus]
MLLQNGLDLVGRTWCCCRASIRSYGQEAGIVLHELDKVGCGAAYGKVAMLPIQLLKPLPNVRDRHRHLLSLVSKKAWHLRGRMATEEIYTGVESGSDLSFDYLAFVVVAGLIAAVGLATNSSVMIVASMLVSPLMGPILAFSFGTSASDPYLMWKGAWVGGKERERKREMRLCITMSWGIGPMRNILGTRMGSGTHGRI